MKSPAQFQYSNLLNGTTLVEAEIAFPPSTNPVSLFLATLNPQKFLEVSSQYPGFQSERETKQNDNKNPSFII